MKNLLKELQREKQASNKEINIVTTKKEQGKEQNKTISQNYKSSISTPISHVDKLNKSKESGNNHGIVNNDLYDNYDNIVANF
ncbi:hypothetical protein A1C_03400 [Rickettsia akari str. Hartford]|uniref:Uncharacterized protein n=1 Tax=Rickettsia akari (strain Hartford) TaxID=293614 RepID=A8GNJ1_RICAH|nr:hypothetical protein [Rickettsia akari]ABV74966.1 hypothetical protein A1C_03400 [Rickettsia akari str. Hartford]